MLSGLGVAYRRHAILIIAIGILGVIAGRFFAMQTHPAEEHSATSPSSSVVNNGNAFFLPAPESMEELADKADVIVVGTIGREIRQLNFWGYDEQGGMIKAKDKQLPPEAESTFFDFAVQVEQVIKDDGTLQAKKPLVVRTLIKRATAAIDRTEHYSGIFPGDHYLLFLTLNPDHTTYGFYYAAASHLVIDGPVVTQSDGARTPLPFAQGVAPQVFLEQLRHSLNTRR